MKNCDEAECGSGVRAIASVPTSLDKPLLASFLMFASVDFIRSKILTGFPWNLWSYSWSWIPEVIQVLNPIGLFAFNLITISIFCSPLLLVFESLIDG